MSGRESQSAGKRVSDRLSAEAGTKPSSSRGARPASQGAAGGVSARPGFVAPSMNGGVDNLAKPISAASRSAGTGSRFGTMPALATQRLLAALTERQVELVAELAEVDAEIAELVQDQAANHDIQLDSGGDPSVMGDMPTPQFPSLPAPSPQLDFVTVADVAERLRVKPQTVRRWRTAGKLPPAIDLGGIIRWRVDVIDEWMAAQGAGGAR